MEHEYFRKELDINISTENINLNRILENFTSFVSFDDETTGVSSIGHGFSSVELCLNVTLKCEPIS